MVHFSKKNIKGNEYLYAEHSFRLPDQKIKKISKRVYNQNNNIKFFLYEKEIEEYQKFNLNKYKFDRILTETKIKKFEEIKIKYKKIINNLTKKQISDILDRFTINFTYESNAIEGNSLTLKDVTLILNEKIVPKNKELREIYETKNTREAHELLFKNKIKINKQSIINLHKIIVKDTGVLFGYKKIENFLLMRNVKTILPEKVDEEMNKLIEWYNINKNKIHPIILASEFHAKFEQIHPFEDGNGRVGRILINAILIEHNYPPLIVRKTMRLSYFNALEAFDKGYKDKLHRFLIEKFEKTFKNFFEIYYKYV
jgi:Fic family protein